MGQKFYAPSTNSTISLLTATNKREKTPVMSQRTGESNAGGDMETKIFHNKKTVFDPKMFTRSESAASIDLLKLR